MLSQKKPEGTVLQNSNSKILQSPSQFIAGLEYKGEAHLPHFRILKSLNTLIGFPESENNNDTQAGTIYLMYWLTYCEYTFSTPEGLLPIVIKGSEFFKNLKKFLVDNDYKLTYEASITYIEKIFTFLNTNQDETLTNSIKNYLAEIEHNLQKRGRGSWTPKLSWIMSKKKNDTESVRPDWQKAFKRVCDYYLYKYSDTVLDVKYKAVRETVAKDEMSRIEQNYSAVKEGKKSWWNPIRSFWPARYDVAAFLTYINNGLIEEEKKNIARRAEKEELTEHTHHSEIDTYAARLGLAVYFQSEIESEPKYFLPFIWSPNHSTLHQDLQKITGKESIDKDYIPDKNKQKYFTALYEYLLKCQRELKHKKDLTPEERKLLELLPKITKEVSDLMLAPIKDEEDTWANRTKQKTKYASAFFVNNAIYKFVSALVPDNRGPCRAAGVIIGEVVFEGTAAIFTANPILMKGAGVVGAAVGGYVGDVVGANVPSIVSGYVIAALSPVAETIGSITGGITKSAVKGVVYAVDGGFKLIFESDDPEISEKLSEKFNQKEYQAFVHALAILPTTSSFTEKDKKRLDETHVIEERSGLGRGPQ